jgi:hypothetical protein
MDRIGSWIDAKPYRFTLMLLANTAAFSCAILIAWPISDTGAQRFSPKRRAVRAPR